MGFSKITYNGFTFPDRSNISVGEEYVYDDAGVTIVRTRFKLRVQTTIVNETPTLILEDDQGSYCGAEVLRARQLLSKVGEELRLEHDGFGSRPFWIVGGSLGNLVRDVGMGPKPKILQWTPVHTTAAEIVWECEFEVPVCNGQTPPKFKGVSSFNYTITYDLDDRFYTTRRISGYLEISNWRNGRVFNDSIEEYRNFIDIACPSNFKRSATWHVTADRRRAEFSITDTEIPSLNIFPAGVVNIEADHDAEWNSRRVGHIGNTISATIELAADQPRWRAWEIFRTIVTIRRSYAQALGLYVLLDSIRVREQLYGMKVSFSASYRIAGQIGVDGAYAPAVGIIFQASGLLQPLEIVDQYNPNSSWARWHDSNNHLRPFEGGINNRGIAGLKHSVNQDRVVDPCDNTVQKVIAEGSPVKPSGQGYQIASICNAAPPADASWLRFNAKLAYREMASESVAVTLGPNDLETQNFNPRSPDAQLPKNKGDDIKRFFEAYAGVTEFTWSGMAERVGYEIPFPGNLQIGGQLLVPVKNGGTFETRVKEVSFCQPVYQAVWTQKYRPYKNPDKMPSGDAVPKA